MSYSPGQGTSQTYNEPLVFLHQYYYSTTQVVQAVRHSLNLAEAGATCTVA